MPFFSFVRFLLVLLTCEFLGCIYSPIKAAETTAKPNIIFILADDLGMGSVSCYGADHFKTPNIDALAQSGVRFLRAYSSPVCGPSRAELLTGRYPFRTGMVDNKSGDVMKPSREILIPTVLKPAGYVTVQVGKWSQLPLQPSDWGFDEYLRFANSGKYWNTQKQNKTYTVNGKEVALPDGKYLPDVMNDFLVDFIQRHKAQPFYAYYAMSHVHREILPTPDTVPGTKDFYADNVAYMDKLVGKLVAEIDRLGLRKNTLIIFCSDNGTAPMYSNIATIHGQRLSGQKGTMLEGGSHIPFIASWPGTIPPGVNLADLIDFSDILPTLAEVAGAKLPAGVTLDGHSFLPQLEGLPGDPRSWVYVELHGQRFVCDAKWKLDNFQELLDLEQAPFKEILVKNPADVAGAVDARLRLYHSLESLVGKEDATNGTQSILTWRTNKHLKEDPNDPNGADD